MMSFTQVGNVRAWLGWTLEEFFPDNADLLQQLEALRKKGEDATKKRDDLAKRMGGDPDNEEAALGCDPLEREAAAAVRCLGVGSGVGEEFFAKAAAELGGKQKPPLLKGTMNRSVTELQSTKRVLSWSTSHRAGMQ